MAVSIPEEALSIILSDPIIITTKAERSIKGISFHIVECWRVIPFIQTTMPRMRRMFAILDPIIFPTAMSVTPFNVEEMLTDNSGADVPKATMVRPITREETPRRLANDEAQSTKIFADFIRIRREMMRRRMGIIIRKE